MVSAPVTVQARTNVSPALPFDIIAPIDLSLIFKGWGPFPGVRGTKNQTGAWDHVGATRNPELTDSSTATESLTEYAAGHSFADELTVPQASSAAWPTASAESGPSRPTGLER